MKNKMTVKNENTINVKIGVFFDGSGCNANNLITNKEHDELKFSNVYRMYKYYDDSDTSVLKAYIEGVGTINGKKDDVVVEGTGRDLPWHKSGVFSKYENSVALLADKIVSYLNDESFTHNTKDTKKLINIEFDLFGFSRGAAIARHFANKVLSKSEDLTKVINDKLASYNVVIGDMATNYLGLYETVVTVWGADALWADPHDTGDTHGLLVNLPENVAKNVFQITARDECRYNFSLSSLQGFYPQLELAGVHSDIGGSYSSAVSDFLSLTGWYLKESNCREEMNKITALPLMKNIINNDNFKMYSSWSGHEGKVRRDVKGALAYVALLIMTKAASAEGNCQFGDLCLDYENKLPNELSEYYQQAIKAYSELMAGREPAIDKEVIDKIAQDYIHISSYYADSTKKDKFTTNSEECLCALNQLTILTQATYNSLSAKDKIAYQQNIESIFGNISPQRPDENWVRKVWHNNQYQ